MKIKNKLILIITWFAVSAIIAFLVVSSILITETSRRDYVNLISTAAEASAANTQLYIDSLEGSFAALTQIVSEIDADERQEFLELYAEHHSGVAYIGINEWFGDSDIDADPILNLEHDGKIYTSAFSHIRTRYGLATRGSIGRDSLIVVFHQDTINGIIQSAELPANGRLILIDPAGGVIDNGEFLGELSQLAEWTGDARQYAESVEFGKVLSLIQSGNNSSQYRVGGNTMVSYVQPIGDSGWIAVVSGDITAAQALVQDSFSGLRALVIVLSIIGLVLAVALTLWITKPLDVILANLQHFNRGDRTTRTGVEKDNEFGEISRLIDETIDDVVAEKSSKEESES